MQHDPQPAEFFAASAAHREILLCSANSPGKTVAGLYALTCHLTGLYPAWWQGKRFARPIHAVVAGDSSKTVREIVQTKLLGPYGRPGTGIQPEHWDQVVGRRLAQDVAAHTTLEWVMLAQQ